MASTQSHFSCNMSLRQSIPISGILRFLWKDKFKGRKFPLPKNSPVYCLLFTALFMVVGCGERTAKLPADESQAFDGAPTEVKQAWDKALATEKAGDYVAAQTAFSGLNQLTLTVQQCKALDDERAAFGQRLTQAADKDDSAAIQALQMALKNRSAR
jgi:hypothetical protein